MKPKQLSQKILNELKVVSRGLADDDNEEWGTTPRGIAVSEFVAEMIALRKQALNPNAEQSEIDKINKTVDTAVAKFATVNERIDAKESLVSMISEARKAAKAVGSDAHSDVQEQNRKLLNVIDQANKVLNNPEATTIEIKQMEMKVQVSQDLLEHEIALAPAPVKVAAPPPPYVAPRQKVTTGTGLPLPAPPSPYVAPRRKVTTGTGLETATAPTTNTNNPSVKDGNRSRSGAQPPGKGKTHQPDKDNKAASPIKAQNNASKSMMDTLKEKVGWNKGGNDKNKNSELNRL